MNPAIRLLTTRPRSGKQSADIDTIWGLTALFAITRHFLSWARDTLEPRRIDRNDRLCRPKPKSRSVSRTKQIEGGSSPGNLPEPDCAGASPPTARNGELDRRQDENKFSC
jgi:hypothetical protein